MLLFISFLTSVKLVSLSTNRNACITGGLKVLGETSEFVLTLPRGQRCKVFENLVKIRILIVPILSSYSLIILNKVCFFFLLFRSFLVIIWQK